jgi:hypothetical protein
LIEDYFRQLDALVTGSPVVHSSRITYDKRSSFVGFIRGNIYFLDSSVLQVREFVNMEQGLERYMYAYHYQRANGTMGFRYDNTPHFPTLSTFPHHKHKADEQTVAAADPPDLEQVLAEIQHLIEIST